MSTINSANLISLILIGVAVLFVANQVAKRFATRQARSALDISAKSTPTSNPQPVEPTIDPEQKRQEPDLDQSQPAPKSDFPIVQKSEAAPDVQACLEEIQDTMGIPWTPANWRSYAIYPSVMQLFWRRIKPVVATERFVREAIALSEHVYQDMSDWYQPSYQVELNEAQQHRLQRELNAFIFGNPQLLIEQRILSRSLRGQVVGQDGNTAPRRDAHPQRHLEIKLLDQPPSEDLAQIYQDIQRTLNAPIVNSDFQAMAKYPAFFTAAWQDFKLWRDRPEYQLLVKDLTRKADEAIDQLHPTIAIGEREIQDLLDDADSFDQLQARIELFDRILPELIVSNAMFLYGASKVQKAST